MAKGNTLSVSLDYFENFDTNTYNTKELEYFLVFLVLWIMSVFLYFAIKA